MRRVMSNPDSLSWSFLQDGKPARATEETSGIDCEAVSDMYTTMLKPSAPLAIVNSRGELTDSTLADVVAVALEDLCQGGVVPAQGTSHKLEPLRIFVVVLLFPGLMEPEYHNTIFKKL